MVVINANTLFTLTFKELGLFYIQTHPHTPTRIHTYRHTYISIDGPPVSPSSPTSLSAFPLGNIKNDWISFEFSLNMRNFSVKINYFPQQFVVEVGCEKKGMVVLVVVVTAKMGAKGVSAIYLRFLFLAPKIT